MPLVYTKEEIKAYLEDRGFDTSDDDMINKFIHDLKKMVKYEDRQKRRVKLGHDPQQTNLDSTEQSAVSDSKTSHKQSNAKDSENADVPRPKDKTDRDRKPRHGGDRDIQHKKIESSRDQSASHVSVSHSGRYEEDSDNISKHDDRHKKDWKYKANAEHSNVNSTTNQSTGGSHVETNHRHQDTTDHKRVKKADRQNPDNTGFNRESRSAVSKTTSHHRSNPYFSKDTIDTTCQSIVSYDNTKNHSKDDIDDVLLILNQLLGEDGSECGGTESVSTTKTFKGPSDSVKRDPVALYHYYRKIWDKQSIPGQNRHMQLRWNVRAQTVGKYPCVDGRAVKYLR